jgi:glycosyl transferase family 25
MNNCLDNVFVIHVNKGYEDRKAHIDSHLPERGIISFNYMLKGDISDLTNDIIDKYFHREMDKATMSCFYKHLLVYKKMVENNIPSALILEDDAFLAKNSLEIIKRLDIQLIGESNYIVNIEQTNRHVPLSIKEKNKILYLCERTKRAGGYVIDIIAAKKIVDFMNTASTQLPIDSFISEMRNTIKYNIYWLDPSIVIQGSKNGKFHSVLSHRKKSKFVTLTSFFRDLYQKNIVSNISKKRKKPFLNVCKY